MKKIVFVDSDGTLKNNKGIISEKTKETISRLQHNDVEVVITTGRPRYHALKVRNSVNGSRYLISSNGAEVYDIDEDKIIYANYLDNESIIKVDKIMKKYNCRCAMTVGDKEVVQDEVKNANQVLLEGDLLDFIKNNHVKQLFIRSDNEQEAISAYNEINKLDKTTIINESTYFKTGEVEKKGIWFTITSKDVNKGRAIKELSNYLKVDLADTYGVGNDYNDIDMFKMVRCSIVMDNANDDLKNHANIIAKSNDEDGVALILDKLFLEKE